MFEFYETDISPQSVTAQVIDGLSATPKLIAPKFFYDEAGSLLFEAITRLPEYYPTRTEVGLLSVHGGAIAAAIGTGCSLIEYGSGSSEKIRLLLDAVAPVEYVPLDISADFLRTSAEALAKERPGLKVRACAVDYTHDFTLPFETASRRVGFFPGSSIGNFSPAEATAFLRRVHDFVGPGGGFLLGVDLKKDPAILHAAYNDSQGVTAQFNLNVLSHLNRLVQSDFDIAAWRHVAFYNEVDGRIEMHLEALQAQRICIGEWSVEVAAGERIHTENSYKFDHGQIVEEARAAGFSRHQRWTDANDWFAVYYLYS